MDSDADPKFDALAGRRGWLVVQARSAAQAIREVIRCEPRVAIVQFTVHVVEALEIIDTLRNRWPQIPLIAVVSSHHDEIERIVRSAGASCYFSGSGAAELVDQAVAHIVARGASVVGMR